MKLTISLRKTGEAKKPHCEMPKGKVEVAGLNAISKRKAIIRERGAPCTPPGMGSKSIINQSRKSGDVPAILYAPGMENEMITVQDFHAVLREIKKDRLLATTIFELVDASGKVRKAIVKDIQYNVASYAIEHIDFLCLDGDKPVALNVPINFVGLEDCVGIKAGGIPNFISRSIKLVCKPSEIPALGFVANIKGLMMPGTQTSASDPVSLSVADVEIPASVREASKSFLTPNVLKSVVVAIAKK